MHMCIFLGRVLFSRDTTGQHDPEYPEAHGVSQEAITWHTGEVSGGWPQGVLSSSWHQALGGPAPWAAPLVLGTQDIGQWPF